MCTREAGGAGQPLTRTLSSLSSTTPHHRLLSMSTGSGGRPGLAAGAAACSSWLLPRQNMSARWLLTESSESETEAGLQLISPN